MLRLAGEHFAVGGDGGVQLARIVMQHAEIVVRFDQVGVDADRCGVLRACFVAPVQGAQHPPQHDARFGVVGTAFGGAGVMVCGARQVTEGTKAVPYEHVQFEVLRVMGKGLLGLRHGFGVKAAHELAGHQELPGVELRRLLRQDLGAQALGFVVLARLLCLHGGGQKFGDQ